MAGVIPPQLSEPQVPVAKAQVNVELSVGIAMVTASVVPVTADCCSPVFQFAFTVTSLNGLKKVCAEAVVLNSAIRATAKTKTVRREKANRIDGCLPGIVMHPS